MFLLYRTFNSDHNQLLLLEIWLDIVLFKKYTHKFFWLRLSQTSLEFSGLASAKILNVCSSQMN